MTIRIASILMAALVPVLSLQAADLGDIAAPLQIADWVKGAPVDLAKGKGSNVYVVEFWATWCGPCRMSIPHLTEMQRRFKDKGVTFVGVSDEPVAKVRPFVEKMGEKMDYVVACDSEKKTSQGYMSAFRQNGIPCAFIVNKQGRVVWIGHPMDGLDQALEQVLEGKLNPAAERTQAMIDEYFVSAGENSRNAEAEKIAADILEAAAGDCTVLCDFADRCLQQEPLNERYIATARNAARAAVKASQGRDPRANEMLALAWFKGGNHERAVRYQQMSVQGTTDEAERARRQAQLEKYQQSLAGQKAQNSGK